MLVSNLTDAKLGILINIIKDCPRLGSSFVADPHRLILDT